MGSTRVALVTGASQGIGAAIAKRLASDGFDLGLTAESPVDDTARAVEDAGRRVVTVTADFTDASTAAGVVEEVAEGLGRLDVLVNNAGWTLTKPLEDTTDDEFDAVMSINLKAGWVAARAAAPLMREAGGGSIVNVSSVHGIRGMRDHSVYAASKGAVDALTRQLAIELAPHRIRVNAVRPGLIEVERYFEDGTYTSEKGGEAVPIGRPGKPADVAEAVSFLAGDRSGFITGHILDVDGGSAAAMPAQLAVFDEGED
jgi:glucose 1-dehydrogenase